MGKHSVLTVALAGLLVVLGASQAYALGGPTLKAEIPFEFGAGGAALSPGEYTIQQASGASQHVIHVRAEEGSTSAILVGNSTWRAKTPQRSELVFNKYGDRYFLREVRVEGMSGGWQFPTTRAERELTRQASRFEVVTVLARR